MNKAAVVLVFALVLAVSTFVTVLGYAVYMAENRHDVDFIVFHNEYGNVTISCRDYNFSPPVPMYRALRIALESDGWNTSTLWNMTVGASLEYREFMENVTIVNGKSYTNVMSGVDLISEVTQPVVSYDPVVVQSATNGTITYRYVWDIIVRPSSGVPCIPPPGLHWIDAATAETVSPRAPFI